jgi:hypothetical protein
VLAVYTSGHTSVSITSAQGNISPYFDGGFWTGDKPPFFYPFTPYSAVIDMEDGKVLAMDTQSSYLSTGQILSAVQQANSD